MGDIRAEPHGKGTVFVCININLCCCCCCYVIRFERRIYKKAAAVQMDGGGGGRRQKRLKGQKGERIGRSFYSDEIARRSSPIDSGHPPVRLLRMGENGWSRG